MCARRSTTSTRRPRSWAHRSAMVSPKNPDPTMTRSAVGFMASLAGASLASGGVSSPPGHRNGAGAPYAAFGPAAAACQPRWLTEYVSRSHRQPGNDGRGPAVAAARVVTLRGVRRHGLLRRAAAAAGKDRAVHRTADPPWDQPVTAAHDDVPRVLPRRGESVLPEFTLQPQFRTEQVRAAAPFESR